MQTLTRYSFVAFTVALSFASAAAAAAPARGFLELSGGIAQPIADDDYTEIIDTSFKLALRGGAWLSGDRGTRLGLEVGADYTFANFDGPNVDARRLRILGGFRGLVPIGAGIGLVVRAAAGIDYASYDAEVSIFDIDGSDLGLGLEAGAGLVFNVGRSAYVGAQLAVPVGFHSAEDEGIDFTSVDLDVLFTLGIGF